MHVTENKNDWSLLLVLKPQNEANVKVLPEHDRPSFPNVPVEHIHSGPLYDVAHVSWHPADLHDIGLDTLNCHDYDLFL